MAPPKGSPKQPGSGRKKGTKNRITKDVRDLARELVPDSIAALRTMVRARAGKDRLGAAKEILDRAYGKSLQGIVHSGAIASVDLTKATDDELDNIIAVLERVAQRSAGTVAGGEGEAEGSESDGSEAS